MNAASARQRETTDLYKDYYASKGNDRNDPLRNAGVLFQNLAFDKSIVEALRHVNAGRDWRILDVGCGSGFSLLRVMTWGLDPEQMQGIDIREDRVAQGRKRVPSLDLRFGDATAMEYPSGSFDLVMESTMFTQMTDEATAAAIANEMLRVVKPDGYLLLTDWRYNFGRRGYRGLSRKRIARLFGHGAEVVSSRHGALVPPLGRMLSRYCGWLYFPVCALLPFLVGQMTVVLRKK
jgi:SAM-dependent methyltransferase